MPFLVAPSTVDDLWGVSDKAYRLYVAAGCWSSRQRTYGHVPGNGRTIYLYGGKTAADELVQCGVWLANGEDYVFADIGQRCRFSVAGRQRPRIHHTVRQAVYERDGFACVTCGSTEDLSLDHIQPWSRGGSDDARNLQTMCTSCNSTKGARTS